MAYLQILEAANLFVGNGVVDNDKYLNLETVKLPDMEEIVAKFHSTASYGALEVGGLGLNELLLDFKVGGHDYQSMEQFGVFGQPQQIYTIYGATRNKVDNSLAQIKVIFNGRMKKITPDTFKRGELWGQSFVVSEVTHYEYYFDNAEEFFYDWPSGMWRVNGVNMLAAVNNMLGEVA